MTAPARLRRAIAHLSARLPLLAQVSVAAAGVNLLVVLGRADRLADGDTASLLAAETRVAQLLRGGDLARAAELTWSLLAPQPPAGYLPGILAFTLLGARTAGAWLAMGAVLALGAWGLWRLWGPRSWVATLAILASPMTWAYVEQHGRDVVAGCVLLAILGELHRSAGFRMRRPSFAYGAWLGMGFLTKYTFPMFAVGPTLVAGLALVGSSVSSTAAERRARWTNLAVAVVGFLAVAGAWFAARGREVLNYVGFSMGDEIGRQVTASLRDPTTAESMAYYPLALRDALSLPGAVLVALALLSGLLVRDARLRSLSALSGALSGLAVLTSSPQAIDRYAYPAFVALAALLPALLPASLTPQAAGAGTGSARRPLLRSLHAFGSIAAVLAVFVPQYLASAARFAPGVPTLPARYEHPLSSAQDVAWPLGATYLPTDLGAKAWHLDDIADHVIQAMGAPDGTFGFVGPRVALNRPSYAQVLLATSARGGRFDVANVNLMFRPGPADPTVPSGASLPVFVGPLFDGEWPPGDFDVLVVVAAPPDEQLVTDWLRRHPHQVLTRHPAPNGGWIGVVRLAQTFRASAR